MKLTGVNMYVTSDMVIKCQGYLDEKADIGALLTKGIIGGFLGAVENLDNARSESKKETRRVEKALQEKHREVRKLQDKLVSMGVELKDLI